MEANQRKIGDILSRQQCEALQAEVDGVLAWIEQVKAKNDRWDALHAAISEKWKEEIE